MMSKYGVARDLYFPVIKRASMDFAVAADWTPATGDTKISKNGGATANTTNNPTHVGNGIWKLTLTATEMQAALVAITIIDSATKAVEDQFIGLETYGNASAQHEFDFDTAVQGVNVTQWKGSAPNDLASGRVDASAGAVANSAITAAAIAPDAITAAKVAADAITEIQNGLATAAALATVDSVVDGIAANVDAPVSSRLEATNYTAPDNAGITTLTSRLTTGRASNLDNLDVLVSSRLATAGYTAPPSAATVADSVWDEARAGHATAGTFGEGITSVQGNVTGSVGSVASFGTLIADIWTHSSRTLTDVSVTILNKIADRIIRRSYANAAASADGDPKTSRSILGVIARLMNRNAVSGSTLTMYEADDTTPLGTMVLTTNAAADPVVEQDPP